MDECGEETYSGSGSNTSRRVEGGEVGAGLIDGGSTDPMELLVVYVVVATREGAN